MDNYMIPAQTRFLIDQIASVKNIRIMAKVKIETAYGSDKLDSLDILSLDTEKVSKTE